MLSMLALADICRQIAPASSIPSALTFGVAAAILDASLRVTTTTCYTPSWVATTCYRSQQTLGNPYQLVLCSHVRSSPPNQGWRLASSPIA